VPQQTPSVQKPLMHWLPAEHDWPFGFSAQLPDWHVVGAMQSPSTVQVVLQAPTPHT
jgi:hypothetical protein